MTRIIVGSLLCSASAGFWLMEFQRSRNWLVFVLFAVSMALALVGIAKFSVAMAEVQITWRTLPTALWAMMRYLLCTLAAVLLGLTMKAGKRYGGKSLRWAFLRAIILKRDGHKCRECGREAEYKGAWIEVHHLRHVSNGGGYGPLNLVCLCRDCHAVMHVKKI